MNKLIEIEWRVGLSMGLAGLELGLGCLIPSQILDGIARGCLIPALNRTDLRQIPPHGGSGWARA